MAMWAGVQKVSRPIDSCHEMSHKAPTTAEVTAAEAHQRYQGSAELRAATTSDPVFAICPAAMVAKIASFDLFNCHSFGALGCEQALGVQCPCRSFLVLKNRKRRISVL